jgi:phosphoglycolate phosphatase
MSKFKPGFILCDLDGTLIDSVPDLAYCGDEMMKVLGLPPRGQDASRHWVGNGVERFCERTLINSVDGHADPELLSKALPIFKELYLHNNAQRSCVYEGVTEGLTWLLDQGYRLACVTNKAEAFTMPLLRDKGLLDYFEFVVSGDTCAEKKPSPMPLLYAAEKMGVSPENALMIGDSISDVKAARAANFHIICMSYGYNHGKDIREANPDVVIDSMVEFSNHIESLK